MNPARFLTDRLRVLGKARPALVGVCVGAGVGFATYLAVFMLTRPGLPAWINVSSALFNAGSAMVLAAAVIAILRLQVFGRRFVVQALAHGGLAAAFTYLWYLAVIILNGIRAGSLTEGFEVNPLVSVALTWQLFQGIAIYAVAAMGAYVIHVREALTRLRDTLRRQARGERVSIRTPHNAGRAANPEAVERAPIPVERIAAPVYLLGGMSDQTWASGDMALNIADAREAAGLPTTALVFGEAGHGLGGPPTRPSDPDTAAANAEAFPALLDFLDAALRR